MARKLDRSGDRERLLSEDGEPPSEEPRSALTRRSYIGLGATTVAALSVTTAANGSIRRHGIEFDRAVDAVDDLGIDPTGGAAVDERLARAGDGTLVQFPDGEYRLGGFSFGGGTRGFEAVGEQVSFDTSGAEQGFLVDGQDMDAVYVDGIDLDQRQSTSAGVRLTGDRVVVQNVDVVGGPDAGRGLPVVTHATLAADGRSRIRNLTATAGGGRRPLGRPGIFVVDDHEGTLTVEDCDLRRFPDGAVHAARHSGRVHVRNSHFENNALSIRLSGSGSSIEHCSIVVEELPPIEPGTAAEPYRFHGVSIATAAGGAASTAGSQPVRISDSQFRIEPLPAAVPAIVVPSAGPALEFVESSIAYNNDGGAVVLGRRPGRSPAGVRPLRMRETSITGSGSVDSVVELADAAGSELEASHILFEDGDSDGIRIRDSADCRVESTDITVPGRAAVFTDTAVDCLAVSGGPDGESTAGDRSPGPDALVIDGSAAVTAYEFTVDGRIDPETDSYGYPPSGTHSEAVVGRGTDRYTVEGEITDLRLDGAGTVYLNGRPVDPESFDSGYNHELVFDPAASTTSYGFTVGELSPWSRPAAGSQFTVSDSTTVDRYRFDGTVDTLSVRGTATVRFGQSERH